MSDGRIELGPVDRSASSSAAPRRRLFEGGSGIIPSSFSHKSPSNLQSEAFDVREQAASLSSRAVLERIQDNPNTIIEEDAESAEHAISGHDDEQSGVYQDDYTLGKDISMGDHGYNGFSASILDTTIDDSRDDSYGPGDSNFNSMNVQPQLSDQAEQMLIPSSSIGDSYAPSEKRLGVMNLISYVPSVLVGSLLNILDGLSYGMILFPLGVPVFAGLESAGLALFYTSTIIAQLVFSLGGSGFKSCIGSEMIEIVPFFHALAISISNKLAGYPREEILATTIASFALSCVITGLTFFLLGWLKLGTLVGFFPLHILLGCIGGVGWFLIATGVEVSARLQGGIEYNWATLRHLFVDLQTVAQWGSCLAMGALLMYAERRLHHPLVIPSILVGTFVLFHVTVAVVPGISLDTVRASGWVFPAQEAGEPWYWIYTLYKPSLIHIGPILECIPVMLALNFFGIIHVPINIPALAAAIKEDSFNVNRELVAHGISNTLSGLLGSIQNYLVYTNSVMFIKSGADSPAAGVMLALATTGIMLAGPQIIGFIPVIVVGSLIFMMGFDLIAEALIDTYGSVRKTDYATMVAITLIMGIYDFVVGIVAGIVLACLFFVIINARRSPVSSQMSGSFAHSTVIRHPLLQEYLDNVGKQVYIFRLSGALFFGTNGTLEREIRKLCDVHAESNTNVASIKYLIIDLENVNDIDYCTVDTFMRLKRLLDARRIRLVLSGAETAGHKIRGLKAVDLVPEVVDHTDPFAVRVFASLNIALSWCENQFIKEYYHHKQLHIHQKHLAPDGGAPHHQFVPTMPTSVPGISQWGKNEFGMVGSPAIHRFGDVSTLGTTPRSSFIKTAARSAAQDDIKMVYRWRRHQQPVALLMQIVDSVTTKNVEFWAKIAPFFEERTLSTGKSLPLGFHLIESGILHIQYSSGYYETALAGTAVGELTPQMKRETEIITESDTKLWSLSLDKVQSLRDADQGAELFTELLSTYLVLFAQRYNRMTDYYRIAALS